MPRGRPKSFDPQAATAAAMRAFWRDGYAAYSVNDLQEVVAASKPTLYAAFGGKDGLYVRALQRYDAEYLAPEYAALDAAPTLREGLEGWLASGIARYSGASGPKGCLMVRSLVELANAGGTVGVITNSLRDASVVRLEARLARAVAAGELPPGRTPPLVALYLLTLRNGLATMGASGAPRSALFACAQIGLVGLTA
jgi:AcrR family transcriptional regulator